MIQSIFIAPVTIQVKTARLKTDFIILFYKALSYFYFFKSNLVSIPTVLELFLSHSSSSFAVGLAFVHDL